MADGLNCCISYESLTSIPKISIILYGNKPEFKLKKKLFFKKRKLNYVITQYQKEHCPSRRLTSLQSLLMMSSQRTQSCLPVQTEHLVYPFCRDNNGYSDFIATLVINYFPLKLFYSPEY